MSETLSAPPVPPQEQIPGQQLNGELPIDPLSQFVAESPSGGISGHEKLQPAESVAPERVRTFGAKLLEASEVRALRKERHEKKIEGGVTETGKKLPGLKGSLETRKEAVKDARKAVRFAQKGYHRKERKAIIATQTQDIYKSKQASRSEDPRYQTPVRKEGKGLLGRAGSKLDLLAQQRRYKKDMKNLHKESKKEAKVQVKQQERDAAQHLTLRQKELQLAKLRRAQTRQALRKSKFHIGGNHANIIASAQAANRTTEERLDNLQANRKMNQYFQKNELMRKRIQALNSEINALRPSQPEIRTSAAPGEVVTPDSGGASQSTREVSNENLAGSMSGFNAAFEEATLSQGDAHIDHELKEVAAGIPGGEAALEAAITAAEEAKREVEESQESNNPREEVNAKDAYRHALDELANFGVNPYALELEEDSGNDQYQRQRRTNGPRRRNKGHSPQVQQDRGQGKPVEVSRNKAA